jgi:HNH endonuclease
MSAPNRSRENLLTLERLRELLIYDAQTGVFTRRIPVPGRRAGTFVGGKGADGYLWATVDGRNFIQHRLAWFYSYGKWPEGLLDHINRNRADNRLSNLREATGTQNAVNRSARNGRTLKGITQIASGKWQAQIQIGSRYVYLGIYETAEEAAQVFHSKAVEIHGEFAPELLQ